MQTDMWQHLQFWPSTLTYVRPSDDLAWPL